MEAARSDPLPIHNRWQAGLGKPKCALQHVAGPCDRVQQKGISRLLGKLAHHRRGFPCSRRAGNFH
eukprot:11105550-Prorocentrum_lima.AAC.1